jgi:hypothetical protein
MKSLADSAKRLVDTTQKANRKQVLVGKEEATELMLFSIAAQEYIKSDDEQQ